MADPTIVNGQITDAVAPSPDGEASSGVGDVAWMDLTVPNAEEVRDFYMDVVGWGSEPVSMGEYSDFNMTSPATGEPRAGVCHARGGNANLPPVWLVYLQVADLDASIARCRERGGEVVAGPRSMGSQRYCVIKDPAGASVALYEKGD